MFLIFPLFTNSVYGVQSNNIAVDAAIPISIGTTNGTIVSTGQSVEYGITLVGDFYIALTSGGDNNFNLVIYNSNSVVINSAKSSYYPEVVRANGYNGDYIIQVISYTGIGDFTLVIKDPIGTSIDNPIITANSTITGYLLGTNIGGSLWYKTSVSGDRRIFLSGPSGSEFGYNFYYPNGTMAYQLEGSIYTDPSKIEPYPKALNIEEMSGDYLIQVFTDRGIGNFNLTISDISSESGAFQKTAIPISQQITNDEFIAVKQNIWYNLTLDGNYIFTLNGLQGVDFDMYLYNSSLNIVESSHKSIFPDEILVYNYTGVYYLRVEAWAGIGTFSLNMTSYLSQLGDHITNAIPITGNLYDAQLPGPARSLTTAGDGAIWYSISLSGFYEITLETNISSYRMSIYHTEENILFDTTTSYRNYIQTPLLNETIYIEVKSYGVNGTFNLSFENKGINPGFSFFNAIPIIDGFANGTSPGVSYDDSTFYTVYLKGDYQIELYSFGADFDLIIYNENQREVESLTGTENPNSVSFYAQGGDYYFEVYAYDNELGNFSLSIYAITTTTSDYSYSDPYDEFTAYTSSTVDNQGDAIGGIVFGVFMVFLVIGIGAVYANSASSSVKKSGMKSSYTYNNKSIQTGIKNIPSYCTACGTRNVGDAIFCQECGTKLQ